VSARREHRSIYSVCASLALLGLTAFGQVSAPPNGITITLDRQGCLGKCPSYKLIIHGDGSILYEGGQYVHATGIRKKRIDPTAVQQMVQKFLDVDFFNLPDSYGVANDLPYVTMSLALNGRRKQITGTQFPDRVRGLQAEIDRVSGSKRWVRRSFFHLP
jgi:hypothetical protein